ncbi:MAG: DNA cytosine methyltransferase [Pirellulales bacterium]|nr:DNA cytosine methyltransferase [Pirellulales bacterium]
MRIGECRKTDRRDQAISGRRMMRTIELFAGAGGLALGTMSAGFRHEAVVEWDRNACDTIRENNRRGVIAWPLHQVDVREFEYSSFQGLDLVAGGPPCQPFSIGGKHRGHADHRNLFPEAVRAVREIQPRAVLIENVKGLLRASFARYFEYIVLQLTYPGLRLRKDEDWASHLSRLERHHTKGGQKGLHYHVVFSRLNAADFGVPQRRERVFIVAFWSDIDAKWAFPQPTHSQDALFLSKWGIGDYWERHKVAKRDRPTPPSHHRAKVDRLREMLFDADLAPWLTVRDAIADLPDPRASGNSVLNHWQNGGARVYGGHTGSPLDEPAKTLKAGDHGVPGGENMLAYPNGDMRYFTVRESARLQTFPDDFAFQGSWTESMRQLGNAVPVALAKRLASSIRNRLDAVA